MIINFPAFSNCEGLLTSTVHEDILNLNHSFQVGLLFDKAIILLLELGILSLDDTHRITAQLLNTLT